MIKINLCPIDELENQYWYVPDLVVTALVGVAVFLALQFYLGTIQNEIDVVLADVASLEESTANLSPDLERFKHLGKDISDLNSKLNALTSITVSKIAKYKPVIVLEHLQNLRPEGVWFESVRIGFGDPVAKGGAAGATNQPPDQAASEDSFEIRGQAFDNILTAEFMTAIRSTDSQDIDSADLRTQVYFNDLTLVEANIGKGSSSRGFAELALFPVFSVRGYFRERSAPALPVKPDQMPIGAVQPSKAHSGDPHVASDDHSVDLKAPIRRHKDLADDEISDAQRSRRF